MKSFCPIGNTLPSSNFAAIEIARHHTSISVSAEEVRNESHSLARSAVLGLTAYTFKIVISTG
jgi:hypothetical protein